MRSWWSLVSFELGVFVLCCVCEMRTKMYRYNNYNYYYYYFLLLLSVVWTGS